MTPTKEQLKIYTEYEESPCIFVCTLVDNGQEDMCIGCGRTDTEIEEWLTYTNEEKKVIKAKCLNRLQDDQNYTDINKLQPYKIYSNQQKVYR